MTSSQSKTDDSIASYTVAELEAFVTETVKDVLQREKQISGNPLLGGLTAKEILEKPYDTTARPFWEVTVEMFSDLTEEDWAGIPADASTNVDHYLYGTPKNEE